MNPAPVDSTIPQSPQSFLPNFTLQSNHPCEFAGDAPGVVQGIVQIKCQLQQPDTITYPFNDTVVFVSFGGPIYVSK